MWCGVNRLEFQKVIDLQMSVGKAIGKLRSITNGKRIRIPSDWVEYASDDDFLALQYLYGIDEVSSSTITSDIMNRLETTTTTTSGSSGTATATTALQVSIRAPENKHSNLRTYQSR